MPMRGEIQVSAAQPRTEPRPRELAMDKVWQWIVVAIENPEFLMVVLFCAVGLWLSFYFIHYFPDYGAMIVSLEQMP